MALLFANILLIINVLLMFFFFFKIKKQFSAKSYERLIQERMRSILLDFNLQTDQAITILEEKMQELKNLVSDADGRFNALSHKLEAINKNTSIEKSVNTVRSNEKIIGPQQIVRNNSNMEENRIEVYSGYEQVAKKDEFTRRKIVEMSKSGWANDYIAQKLSIPLAEVELILFMESRE